MIEQLLNEIEECLCLISKAELLSNATLKDSVDSLSKSLKNAEQRYEEDYYMLQYIDGGLLIDS